MIANTSTAKYINGMLVISTINDIEDTTLHPNSNSKHPDDNGCNVLRKLLLYGCLMMSWVKNPSNTGRKASVLYTGLMTKVTIVFMAKVL